MSKRILEGKVTNDKLDKTITVLVETKVMHPLYKKRIRSSKKYMVHDEENKFAIGDRVLIEESRPLSKHKFWIVVDNKTEKL